MQKRVKERIELFQVDKSNPLLRDHGLKGTMYPMRSFSITGDLRIIYEEVEFQGDKLVIFIDIGTHNQVY